MFLGLITSIVSAQFGLSTWTHPNIIFEKKTTPHSVYLYSKDDIYFIDKNDSTKIYDLSSAFGTNIAVNQNIDLQIELKHRNNKILFYEDLLKVNVYENFISLNSAITIKKNKIFQPTILLSTHKKYFSIGGIYTIYIKENMFLKGEYSVNKKYFNIALSYDDFLYNPDTQEEKNTTHDINYLYNSNLFSLDLRSTKITNNVLENVNIPTRLKTPFNNEKINSVKLTIKNKHQSAFILGYKNYSKDFSLYFIKNNDPFLKLNKVYYGSQETLFSYKKYLKKSTMEIGLVNRMTDLIISSKIKAFYISPSLESFFGGVLINNIDTGNIEVNHLFVNYKRQIHKHHLKFHLSYTINHYNINIKNNVYTTIIPLFPDPELSTNEMLNYNKSTSFIFGFEDEINLDKIILSFKYYQTIPHKIYEYQSSYLGQNNNDSGNINNTQNDTKQNNGFGLGKFYLNITIPLN